MRMNAATSYEVFLMMISEPMARLTVDFILS